jgi:hypothetical protein
MRSERTPPSQTAPPKPHEASREAGAGPDDADAARYEDLIFRLELWNGTKTAVERVLAEASHGSIAFAAYHAAIREYPNRYVTLRQHGRVLSSCNPPAR